MLHKITKKVHLQKGLTLIELLVGLAVGSIVLTLAWNLFGFMHKGFIHKQKKSSEFQIEYVAEAKLKALIQKHPIESATLGKLRLYPHQSTTLSSTDNLIEVNDSLLFWIPNSKTINTQVIPLTSGEQLIHIQIFYSDQHLRNITLLQNPISY